MGLNERTRRTLNLVILFAAWSGAIGIAAWIVFHGVDTSVRWPTFSVILLMGIGITASLIRSRYKLSDTLREVFYAGVRAGWNTPVRDRPMVQHEEHLPEEE